MTIVGLVIFLIGMIAKVTAIWTIGLIVLIVGAGLAIAGHNGHQLAGHRHWY